MTKKLLALSVLFLMATAATPLAFAQSASSGNDAASKMNQLFQVQGNNPGISSNYIQNLPNSTAGDFSDIYAGITKVLLGLATALVVVGVFVAGTIYVTAQGEEEALKKARNILLYTLLGVIIIAVAYGITLGISKINPLG